MRIRTLTTALAAGGAVAGLAVAGAAGAAPSGSGASVVAQQGGVTTHNLCASQVVSLTASGFAPNRKQLTARVQWVGAAPVNPLFYVTIPLSAGAGSVDVGTPGPDFVGAKLRVRYQTGSSDNTGNYGSFSGTILDC